MAIDGPILLNRYTQDVGLLDSRIQARYIGNLEQGRSKVSVNSTLSVGDASDNFRFRNTSDGFVRFSFGEVVGKDGAGAEAAPDGTVRYQLLSASGQVVADSDPDSGSAYDAFQDLTSGDSFALGKGSYVIRVARDRASIDSSDYIYSFTFRSSDQAFAADAEDISSREFLTTERPGATAATSAATYNSAGAVLGLFSNVNVSLFA